MQSPLQEYIDSLHRSLVDLDEGEVATYIPELAKVEPDRFGICIVTLDGVSYEAGDTRDAFTIQSISKPFVYARALADRGQDFVLRKVGVEPSGDAFNSISLDRQSGAPFNPMINAGAIATSGLVAGDTAEAKWRRIAATIAAFAGHGVHVDEAVYASESDTGHRNRAIAWMLKNFGIIDGDPMAALDNYFRQCSLLVTCRDLAFMAATLANGGRHPSTGEPAGPAENVEQVLSVMATCGMYDYAGSWLYEVGMPAKSGVSGGILAVVPGRFGIGVYSPRLDGRGNSVRGIAACSRLSKDLGLHAFARPGGAAMALGRIYTAASAPSRRKHAPEVRARLRAEAPKIKYLCLHGYLAPDGVEYVTRRMLALASETSAYILDMHEVTGLADSAARLLTRARLGFAEQGVAVVCSRVRDRSAVLGPLSRGTRGGDRGFLVFEDNDLAVEWCERRLLQSYGEQPRSSRPLADSLLFRGTPEPLLACVERVTSGACYRQGETILRQGQQGDGRVFFIEDGHVSILVPLADGAHQRIASLGPGSEFGEMALLGQTTRSAAVVAETDVRCRIMEVAEFERIMKDAPELGIVVLGNLARELASRLRGANEWIAALA